MFRKKKFILGGAVFTIALGALLFSAFGGGSYYYTIGELNTGSASFEGQRLRIIGDVVPGSVQWSAQNFTATFTLSDKDTNQTLDVAYVGALPDNFIEATEAIVEGTYIPGQPFKAEQIIGKCASKYEPS